MSISNGGFPYRLMYVRPEIDGPDLRLLGATDLAIRKLSWVSPPGATPPGSRRRELGTGLS